MYNSDDENEGPLQSVLKKLSLLKKDEERIKNLRLRWVSGSYQWMAGKCGSQQNLKEYFEYNDEEWDYIWNTMAKDKAWSVPNIDDEMGNMLKQNFAPEIMIKYIAHDIQCHIIIIDLQLEMIQFCSGNYLKENNIISDAPILMYSTGNHFQSIYTENLEFFTMLARKLDVDKEMSCTFSNVKLLVNKNFSLQQNMYNSAKQKQTQQLLTKPNLTNCGSKVYQEESLTSDLTLDQLRMIRNKTDSQKKLYNKLRKQEQRKYQSEKEKQIINEKNRNNMAKTRENYSLSEKANQNESDKIRMKKKRESYSVNDKAKENAKDKERKAKAREILSLSEKVKQNEKDKERMKKNKRKYSFK